MSNISRRRFLIGAGAGAGAVLASSQVAAFGLGNVLGGGDSGGGAEKSAEDFKKFSGAATACLLKGVGELKTAIGDKKAAAEYFSLSEATKKNGADFKEIQPMIDNASIDPKSLEKANASKAGPHVAKAYLFTTLAVVMDKKAIESAKDLLSSGSTSMALVKTIGSAKDALKVLPDHAKLGTSIVAQTKDYIQTNGLSLPSADEVKKIAKNNFDLEGGDVDLSV